MERGTTGDGRVGRIFLGGCVVSKVIDDFYRFFICLYHIIAIRSSFWLLKPKFEMVKASSWGSCSDWEDLRDQ